MTSVFLAVPARFAGAQCVGGVGGILFEAWRAESGKNDVLALYHVSAGGYAAIIASVIGTGLAGDGYRFPAYVDWGATQLQLVSAGLDADGRDSRWAGFQRRGGP